MESIKKSILNNWFEPESIESISQRVLILILINMGCSGWDSETTIQKLRFRNYWDSETTIQKLRFRNYDSETIKQSSLHSVLVAKLTGASNRLQKPFLGCFKLMNARLQKLIEVLNGPKGMPFWPCIMLVNEIFFSIITYYYICVCICEYVCVCVRVDFLCVPQHCWNLIFALCLCGTSYQGCVYVNIKLILHFSHEIVGAKWHPAM